MAFILGDGQRSVRALADEGGMVTDRYDYDAFGNLLARSGATPNTYLYAGEQFDPSLGLYNLRARYYDPRQGRFTARDPFAGRPDVPASLHPYAYAVNDPVNRRDPSGRQPLVDEAVAEAAEGDLAVMAEAAFEAFPELAQAGVTEAEVAADFTEIAGEAILDTEADTLVATTEVETATATTELETVSAEGPAFNEFVLNNQGRIAQLLGRFANLPEAARAAQFEDGVAPAPKHRTGCHHRDRLAARRSTRPLCRRPGHCVWIRLRGHGRHTSRPRGGRSDHGPPCGAVRRLSLTTGARAGALSRRACPAAPPAPRAP